MRMWMIAGAAAAAIASGAVAQPYFVRGDFNGWANSSDPMVQVDTNAWAYTVTGLSPGQAYEFKATVDDWSMNAPGSNAKHVADANGELRITLFDTDTHGDGWNPEGKWRLGYEDSGAFDWELIGAMNGWNGGSDWYLTDMGGGLHQGEFLIPAGGHEWKFRSRDSWDFSLGDDFGNAAANNFIDLPADSLVRFTIDMPNGRWTTEIVPTPGAATLLCLAGLGAVRRRR